MNNAMALSFALLLLTGAPVAQDKPSALPPAELAKRIAVVDIERVQSGHPRVAESIQQMQKHAAALDADLKERDKKIEAKQMELKALARDSDEHLQLQLEIRMLSFDLDQREKARGPQLMELRNRLGFQITEDIRAAIKEIATRRGVELVVRAREYDFAGKPAIEDAAQNHRDRDLLYYHPGLDITEDVIRFLKARNPEPQTKDGKAPPAADAKDASSSQPKKTSTDGKSDGK